VYSERSSLDRDKTDQEFWTVMDDWVRRSRRALRDEQHFEALISHSTLFSRHIKTAEAAAV